jgi:hypothetical protein
MDDSTGEVDLMVAFGDDGGNIHLYDMEKLNRSNTLSGLGFQRKAFNPFKLFPVRSASVVEVVQLLCGESLSRGLRPVLQNREPERLDH